MLLGQTLDGMRVWDIRRGIQAVREIEEFKGMPVGLEGRGSMAGNVAYAALFEPEIQQLELWDLPPLQKEAADYLNVLSILDVPQVVAMLSERSRVTLHNGRPADWQFPMTVAKRLGWPQEQLKLSGSNEF